MNKVDGAEDLEVWTSEMKRTKQTAEGIKAPKHCVRALNELDAVSSQTLSVNLF